MLFICQNILIKNYVITAANSYFESHFEDSDSDSDSPRSLMLKGPNDDEFEQGKLREDLTKEQRARAAAEAKSEKYKQAVLKVKNIATEIINELKSHIEELSNQPKPKCCNIATQTDDQTTITAKKFWEIAPLNKWKAPQNTVWFPWLFALSLYGSNFFDVDEWIANFAEHLKLPQLRNFLQKHVIPQKVVNNKKFRDATSALLTTGMLKIAHLIMQKYDSGKLINSEGENPHRLSPNFNTLIHLAGISCLLWKCNNALLTPESDD